MALLNDELTILDMDGRSSFIHAFTTCVGTGSLSHVLFCLCFALLMFCLAYFSELKISLFKVDRLQIIVVAKKYICVVTVY